jgi:hypothetical protein
MGRPLLLLEAAYSYRASGEDRLTELFAATLASHPGFCRALHEQIGLPGGERYLIATQHRIGAECRLDLRIEARDAGGATRSVIYSEHKVDGYWFSDGQVARENAGLEDERADEKRFICVVSAGELATLEATDSNPPPGTVRADDFARVFSWTDVAGLARQAGRAWPDPWGGSGWEDRALEPCAPAAQRVLVEFLAYLKEDEVPEAISADDLLAFRIADEAKTKIDSILMLAAQHVGAFHQSAEDQDIVYDDWSATGVPLRCVNFELPEAHWLAANEDSVLSAAIATTNAAAPWAGEEPYVYAGLYIANEPAAGAQTDREWIATATADNLEILHYEPGLWIVGTRLLSGFTAVGTTLEAQAAALGPWLEETLAASAALGPPRADAASGSGRSRRRRTPRAR